MNKIATLRDEDGINEYNEYMCKTQVMGSLLTLSAIVIHFIMPGMNRSNMKTFSPVSQ